MSPTAAQSKRPTDSGRRIARALFRWKWSALVFFAAFYGLVMVIAYRFPFLYEARATVLVRPGRESLPSGVSTTLEEIGRVVSPLEEVISEMEIMLSEQVLERAADRLIARPGFQPKKPSLFQRLKLSPRLDDRQQLVNDLAGDLTIELIPSSRVLEILYSSKDPAWSRDVVRFLLEEYLKHHAAVHSEPRGLELFNAERDRTQAALLQVQQELADFRLANDGGDLTLKRTLVLQELIATEQTLQALRDAAAGGQELLAGTSALDNPQISSYFHALTELKSKLAAMPLQFAPESDEVKRVQAQLDTARAELADQLRRNQSYLERKVDNLQGVLMDVEAKRQQYEDLTARQALLENTFRHYAAKAEEERIDLAMDANQFVSARVLTWPETPAKPDFPNRYVLALLGLLFGLPAAMAVALARAYFHSRVAGVPDVEKELGVDVLASLPRISRRQIRGGKSPELRAAARLVIAAAQRQGAKVVHLAAASDREGAATLATAVAAEAAENAAGKVVLARAAAERAAAELGRVEILDLSAKHVDELRAAVAAAKAEAEWVILAGAALTSPGGGVHAGLADASVFVVSGAGDVHLEAARRGLQVLQRAGPPLLGAILTRRKDSIPGFIYKRV